MKLTSRHRLAIQLLVDNKYKEKTHHEMAAKLGVDKLTLYRWRNDPDFQAEYEKVLTRWLSNLEGIRFRHRKERILELERLYDATPDSYVEKIIYAKGKVYDPESKKYIDVDAAIIDPDGKILQDDDGNPISVLAVKRSNADAKAKILLQIRDEIEPRPLRFGTGTRDSAGNEKIIFVEMGMPEQIPWGDATAPLPELEDENA